MAMLSTILGWVVKALPVIPNLIVNIEQLWSGTKKAGPQKWLAIEQALSGSIQQSAQAVAALAPQGTKVETISAAISVFSKTVNDAFVKLMNDLGIFATSS